MSITSLNGCPVNPTQLTTVQSDPKTSAVTSTTTADPAAAPAAKDKVDVQSKCPEGSVEVKADGWKKGKNDCLDHMLHQQGYTDKEIYTKDKSGKTLGQRIAAENHLKDPNLIRTGQTLYIPSKNKPEKPQVSTEGLKPGESKETHAANEDRSISQTASNTGDEKKMDTKTDNGRASTTQTTTVGEGGKITGSTSVKGETVTAKENATNAAGDAKTSTVTTADSKGTHTTITETDGGGKTDVTVTRDGLTTVNPGVKNSEDSVKTESKGQKKGLFETLGDWGDRFGRWVVGGPDRASDDLHIDNAKKVEEQRNQDGSRTVSVTDAEGKVQTWNREADGGAQKAGRWFDEKLSAFGKWLTTPVTIDGGDPACYGPMM